jgi:hypothetical protein
MRTTNVSQLEEPQTDANEAPEFAAVICPDCKSPSPIGSLIEVNALHVQCPVCLFVFFWDTARR